VLKVFFADAVEFAPEPVLQIPEGEVAPGQDSPARAGSPWMWRSWRTPILSKLRYAAYPSVRSIGDKRVLG
jgi:hypothetical protein